MTDIGGEGGMLRGEAQSSADFVALKGKFFTLKVGETAGVFCLIYLGGSDASLTEKFFFASRVQGNPNLDVYSRWEEISANMSKIGSYDKEAVDKIAEVIPDVMNRKLVALLFENPDNTEKISEEIQKGLEKAMRYSVQVETAAETFGLERAKAGGLVRTEVQVDGEPKSETAIDGIKLGQMLLSCQPQIDPIHGCPASKIKPGDMLYVKIEESNDVAKKLVGYMQAERTEPLFTVESTQTLDSGKVAVVMRINGEIQGMIKVSHDVMIKAVRSQKPVNPAEGINTTFIIQLAALGGILVFIVLLIQLIHSLI